MLNSLFNSTTVPLLEKVAMFGERRHDVLAGNLANIDTPNYKTRDLSVDDFQAALKSAVERMSEPKLQSLGQVPVVGNQVVTTNPGDPSMQQMFPNELFQAIDAAASNITFQDGGNRSVEHEVMEMTKNSMLQNFAVELMVAQMNMLQAVISERP